MRDFDEIDLHGYTITEALSAFVAFYNARVARGNTSQFYCDPRLWFQREMAGRYGNRLRKYLSRFPDRVEFVPGGQYSGNPGITMVAPKRALPSEEEGLAGEILAFLRSRQK